MKPEYVYIPEPKYSRLKRLAVAQGVKPPAFVWRLITMYEKDPTAFEVLFQQVIARTPETPPQP